MTEKNKSEGSSQLADGSLQNMDESVSSNEAGTSEIIHPKSDIEIMETHAHELHKAPGHGWKHYFFEFFMLFLAITLGFFVENQREHFVEHKREKEYIHSMIEDLKLDTAGFSADNLDRIVAIKAYDSVILLLNKPKKDSFEQQRLYYLARMSLRLSPFPIMNDRTFEQMKSSGNLRLISDYRVADKITTYYFNTKEFSLNVQQTVLRLQSLIEIQGKVFDGSVFRSMLEIENFGINLPPGTPALITDDKKILNELSVRTHYALSIVLYSKSYIVDLNKEATRLIQVLKEAYHLD